jgi:hypothetical protein
MLHAFVQMLGHPLPCERLMQPLTPQLGEETACHRHVHRGHVCILLRLGSSRGQSVAHQAQAGAIHHSCCQVVLQGGHPALRLLQAPGVAAGRHVGLGHQAGHIPLQLRQSAAHAAGHGHQQGPRQVGAVLLKDMAEQGRGSTQLPQDMVAQLQGMVANLQLPDLLLQFIDFLLQSLIALLLFAVLGQWWATRCTGARGHVEPACNRFIQVCGRQQILSSRSRWLHAAQLTGCRSSANV